MREIKDANIMTNNKFPRPFAFVSKIRRVYFVT